MNEPLSYLVEYKNTVDKETIAEHLDTLTTKLNSTLAVLKRSSYANPALINAIQQQIHAINSNISLFESLLNTFKKDIAETINTQESKYKTQSYKMYNDNKKDSSEYILDRARYNALIYRTEIKDYFISRIKALSSWRYSGLFIRPEFGDYVSSMTASDPLYVADEAIELLNPVTKLWNDVYGNRVRFNVISEEKEIIFENYPIEQLGLVVAMNYFNYRPLEVIKRYLIEIFGLLREGGSLIFTYNNCNYALAVKNFEKSQYSYTPETLILPMCKMLGFEIIQSYNNIETNVSWLEVKKPGTLTSMRGGQCLGKIVV